MPSEKRPTGEVHRTRRKLLKSTLLGGGAAGAWYLAPER